MWPITFGMGKLKKVSFDLLTYRCIYPGAGFGMGYNNCERDINEPYMVGIASPRDYYSYKFIPGTHQQAEEGGVDGGRNSIQSLSQRNMFALFRINHFVPVNSSSSERHFVGVRFRKCHGTGREYSLGSTKPPGLTDTKYTKAIFQGNFKLFLPEYSAISKNKYQQTRASFP